MVLNSVYPNSAYPGQNTKQQKKLKFDKVLGQESEQPDVFEAADIGSMVKNVLNGFHSTIFCYGQTGSGKSYTMDGLKYTKNEKGVYVPTIS